MIETNGHDRPNQMDLTQHQIDVLIAVERVGASLSMVGIALIVVSYWAFKRLRTVPNLFILFASIANAGASVACLIGYDGLRAGPGSALCQTQAFLLEMFMQSDPWWSFAMAINVYLVFFRGANPASFRKHVWLYCLACFGIPFIPALICLVAKGDDGTPIYGDATLWCWIGPKFTELRIYTYYLPIWVCIFFSTIIYFAVGYHVFHQRNQLRNLTFSTHGQEAKEGSTSDIRDSAEKAIAGRPDVYGTAVTEVQITTCIPRPWTPPQHPPRAVKSSESLYRRGAGAYPGRDEDLSDPGAESTTHTRVETTCTASTPPAQKSQPARRFALFEVWDKFLAKLRHLDPIKLAYLRTSFVFAISILVTWTPSSINRVHNIVHPTSVSYGLNVASAVVLPLQGVWNAVIFFTTSWTAFREEWEKSGAGKVLRGWIRCDAEGGCREGRAESDEAAVLRELERTRLPRVFVDDVGVEMGSVRVGTVRAMRGSF